MPFRRSQLLRIAILSLALVTGGCANDFEQAASRAISGGSTERPVEIPATSTAAMPEPDDAEPDDEPEDDERVGDSPGGLSGAATDPAPATPVAPTFHRAPAGDVYAASGADVGTIVFVHGGGFRNGSRRDLLPHALLLATQVTRGWDLLAIDYDLGPWPTAVHDLAAAIEFVRSPAGAELGLSSRRIVVAGHSAGAAVALNEVLTAGDGAEGPYGEVPPVDAWISIAGILDFSVAGPADPHDAWRTGGNPVANPITHLDAQDPPGLIVHGAGDLIAPIGHAIGFTARARAVGHPTIPLVLSEPDECSGHLPLCSAAVPILESFLDAVAR